MAFRTTPIEAIEIEASIPPIHLHLDQCARRSAIRFNKLSTRNPSNPPPLPTRRESRAVNEIKKTTQLQQIAALTDPIDERLYPFSDLAAPWRRTERDYGDRLIICGTNGQSKDEAAHQHNSDIRRLQTRDHLLVYTDGSQRDIRGKRRVGAGIVGFRDGTAAFELNMGLGEKAEVYDGEMAAPAMGATKATNHAKEDGDVKHLHFFADNTSAIEAIFDPTPRTGQTYAIVFHRRIRQFLDSDPSHTVEVAWCPGHKDIQGNERADYLAKRGAERSTDAMGRTRANARREAKAKTAVEWKKIWEASPKHGRYATANRFPPSLKPTQHFLDLAGKREVYGRVLQCRTGHGYTGEYYAQFVPSENVDCPVVNLSRLVSISSVNAHAMKHSEQYCDTHQEPCTCQTSSAPKKE